MRCAYCSEECSPTREHVWPEGFLDRVRKTGQGFAHYSPKSGVVHGADYIVRDVCTTCNNIKLSGLDQYFCALYDQYFYDPKGSDAVVEFFYDFDLLLRSLLKIAYNTARSAGSETKPFERTTKYILDGGTSPNGIALIAELVSPSYVAATPWSTPHEIRPTAYRSARGLLKTQNAEAVLVRIVAVGSFFFHLLLARDQNNLDPFGAAVSEFLASIRGTTLVDPSKPSIMLRSSPQDSLRSMMPLLNAKWEQLREFFDLRRKADN